jgi:hypothetical protein
LVKGIAVFLFLSSVLCPPSSVFAAERVEAKDTDRDGKPDEWRIYQGSALVRMERDRDGDGHREVVVLVEKERPVSSTLDRNGDGRPDLFRRYSPAGLPEFDEGDLDLDGQIDYWAWYQQGFKAMAAQDRKKDGEPDAWFFYDPIPQRVVGGAVDEDGDGRYERQWGAAPIEFPR